MRFSQDFIEKVQEANNLVDIISQYTQLKPSGSGLMGRCPFPDHAEKTASFSVSETKQVYHCFGCHKSGNLFSFLRDYQGMSFPEAVEYLAGRASIPMPAPDKEDAQRDQASDKRSCC
ncbi:CHC2 zinc finger domain-containing protein [Bdellovibrio bacteriovorus]|uniref:CHC2 zinc finger domain-containing protein n=1 Tax=Bdellovibrio bacteriovorus TaxID=959 RepID=UPI0035A5832C